MKILEIDWQPVKKRVEGLKLWEKNPRKISPEQYTSLKADIVRDGFHDVLLVDTDNTVLSGNQRKIVLEELGIEEVFCLVPERKLTEDERDRVGLSANLHRGKFDYKTLGEGFDAELMAAVGFSPTDIDRAFDLKTSEDQEAIDKALADKEAETKAKHGDMFQLGDHVLLCGDSTKEEDVARLMGGVRANLVFTDPPYMVDYHSQKGLSYDSKKFGGKGEKIFNDNLDDVAALQFFTDVLNNLYKFTEDNAPLYWWYANKNALINYMAWAETGWNLSQVVIWLKNSMVFSKGQDYHRCMEPCMFGWKKGKTHFRNTEVANLKDVWMQMDYDTFQDQLDVWFQKRDTTNEYVHPTQKPVALPERALRKSSKVGSIVLDLFGGSGSTLMACEQMRRKARVMELDPKYVDVIINRWEKATGNLAVKL